MVTVDFGAMHGTGCTLAALVAGKLAVRKGASRVGARVLIDAVCWAKRVHHAALVRILFSVGGPLRVIAFD